MNGYRMNATKDEGGSGVDREWNMSGKWFGGRAAAADKRTGWVGVGWCVETGGCVGTGGCV